jgi:hypothetical protein
MAFWYVRALKSYNSRFLLTIKLRLYEKYYLSHAGFVQVLAAHVPLPSSKEIFSGNCFFAKEKISE